MSYTKLYFLVWPLQRQQWVLLCNCLVGALQSSPCVKRSFPLCRVRFHPAQYMITIMVTAKKKKTLPWLSSSCSDWHVIQHRCQPTSIREAGEGRGGGRPGGREGQTDGGREGEGGGTYHGRREGWKEGGSEEGRDGEREGRREQEKGEGGGEKERGAGQRGKEGGGEGGREEGREERSDQFFCFVSPQQLVQHS